MNKETKDRIKGVIFGNAIGDALGLGLEGWGKEAIKRHYPNGYSFYNQGKRIGWQEGEWTDDTEQMLCIMDSIIEKGEVDIKDIARRIYNWARGGGKGIGMTVASVIYSPGFIDDPYSASKRIWEISGRYLAPNGGIMRTSPLGIWRYWEKDEVIKNAEDVCRITHFDPRCVGSCVAVCIAISSFLNGIDDPVEIYRNVLDIVKDYDPRIGPYLELAKGEVSEIKLDEKRSMGYTLKTLASGFWAMLNSKTFEEGLLTVINEGGDTDTNGAVSGALLGARFGYSGIPHRYIRGLLKRDILEEKIDLFTEINKKDNDL